MVLTALNQWMVTVFSRSSLSITSSLRQMKRTFFNSIAGLLRPPELMMIL